MAAPTKISELTRADVILQIRRHLSSELADMETSEARSIQIRVIDLVKQLKVLSSSAEEQSELLLFKRNISDWSLRLKTPAEAAGATAIKAATTAEEALHPEEASRKKLRDSAIVSKARVLEICKKDGFHSIFFYVLYSFCQEFSSTQDFDIFDLITKSLKNLKKAKDNPIKAFRSYLQDWAKKNNEKGTFRQNPVLACCWLLTCSERGNEIFDDITSADASEMSCTAPETLDSAYIERTIVHGSKATIISIQQAHIIREILQLIALPMVQRSALLSETALSSMAGAVESDSRFFKESPAEAFSGSHLYAHIDDPEKRFALWSHNSLILQMNFENELRVHNAVNLMIKNLLSDDEELESSIELINEFHHPKTSTKRKDAIIHRLILNEHLTILFSREKLLFYFNNLHTYMEELRDTRKLLVYGHILRCNDKARWSDVPRSRAVAHLQEYIRLHPQPDMSVLDAASRPEIEAQWWLCQTANEVAEALDSLKDAVQKQSDMIDTDYMRSFSTLRALLEMKIVRFGSETWSFTLPISLKHRELRDEAGTTITIPALAACAISPLKLGAPDPTESLSVTADTDPVEDLCISPTEVKDSSFLFNGLIKHLETFYNHAPFKLETSKAAFANGLHYAEILVHLYIRCLETGMNVERLGQMHLDINTASYYAIEQLITAHALETHSIDSLKEAKLFFDTKGHRLRERFSVSGLSSYRSLRKVPAVLKELEGAVIAVLYPETDARNPAFISIRGKIASLDPSAKAPEETLKDLQVHILDSLCCIFTILEPTGPSSSTGFLTETALESIRSIVPLAIERSTSPKEKYAVVEEIRSLSMLIPSCLDKSTDTKKITIRRTNLTHLLQRLSYFFEVIEDPDKLTLFSFYCNQARIVTRHLLEEFICVAQENQGKELDQLSIKHDLSKLLKDFSFTSSLEAGEMSFIRDSAAQRNNLRYSTKMKRRSHPSPHTLSATAATGRCGSSSASDSDAVLDFELVETVKDSAFHVILSKPDQLNKRLAEEELKIALRIASKVAAEAFP